MRLPGFGTSAPKLFPIPEKNTRFMGVNRLPDGSPDFDTIRRLTLLSRGEGESGPGLGGFGFGAGDGIGAGQGGDGPI